MTTQAQKQATGPRRLPIVEWEGVAYFIDERLRELRAVTNVHHRVEFGSATGRAMLRNTGIVTCARCGREFGIALRRLGAGGTVCPACQTPVELARPRFSGRDALAREVATRARR
jgi:hypothetical protein